MLDGDTKRWEKLSPTSAAFAGAELGAPTDVFTPETDLGAITTFTVDPTSVTAVVDWFPLVAGALDELRWRHHHQAPTMSPLWPEHFELAFSMAEMNLGGPPGDATRDQPNQYLGPRADLEGPRCNEPWGMSIPSAEVGDASEAIEFSEACVLDAFEVAVS